MQNNNNNSNKNRCNLKLESRELIPYIADLAGPFIFSEVNKKKGKVDINGGSLENTGYPNGLPYWGTYLGGCRN